MRGKASSPPIVTSGWGCEFGAQTAAKLPLRDHQLKGGGDGSPESHLRCDLLECYLFIELKCPRDVYVCVCVSLLDTIYFNRNVIIHQFAGR